MGDSTRDATVTKMFASLDRVVWGITAATDDARGGLLATWVMQTSLDMASPGLMVGLAPNHFTTELIEASGRFVVHLLSPDQIDVALQLAIGSGRDRDKLAGLTCPSGPCLGIRLATSHSWAECQVYARLRTGDRTYFWADVLVAESGHDSQECLREGRLLASATPQQADLLRENMAHDIKTLRLPQSQWRSQMPSILNPLCREI